MIERIAPLQQWITIALVTNILLLWSALVKTLFVFIEIFSFMLKQIMNELHLFIDLQF